MRLSQQGPVLEQIIPHLHLTPSLHASSPQHPIHHSALQLRYVDSLWLQTNASCRIMCAKKWSEARTRDGVYTRIFSFQPIGLKPEILYRFHLYNTINHLLYSGRRSRTLNKNIPLWFVGLQNKSRRQPGITCCIFRTIRRAAKQRDLLSV